MKKNNENNASNIIIVRGSSGCGKSTYIEWARKKLIDFDYTVASFRVSQKAALNIVKCCKYNERFVFLEVCENRPMQIEFSHDLGAMDFWEAMYGSACHLRGVGYLR